MSAPPTFSLLLGSGELTYIWDKRYTYTLALRHLFDIDYRTNLDGLSSIPEAGRAIFSTLQASCTYVVGRKTTYLYNINVNRPPDGHKVMDRVDCGNSAKALVTCVHIGALEAYMRRLKIYGQPKFITECTEGGAAATYIYIGCHRCLDHRNCIVLGGKRVLNPWCYVSGW